VATGEVPALTLSAFQGPSVDDLVMVGVKEGGPSHFRVELPQSANGPASWELYETTRELDCQKVDVRPAKAGHVDIELPAEVIFTLVGRSGKAE
jgi:hypothetical protein